MDSKAVRYFIGLSVAEQEKLKEKAWQLTLARPTELIKSLYNEPGYNSVKRDYKKALFAVIHFEMASDRLKEYLTLELAASLEERERFEDSDNPKRAL